MMLSAGGGRHRMRCRRSNVPQTPVVGVVWAGGISIWHLRLRPAVVMAVGAVGIAETTTTTPNVCGSSGRERFR
jgi:hypothetical protein